MVLPLPHLLLLVAVELHQLSIRPTPVAARTRMRQICGNFVLYFSADRARRRRLLHFITPGSLLIFVYSLIVVLKIPAARTYSDNLSLSSAAPSYAPFRVPSTESPVAPIPYVSRPRVLFMSVQLTPLFSGAAPLQFSAVALVKRLACRLPSLFRRQPCLRCLRLVIAVAHPTSP